MDKIEVFCSYYRTVSCNDMFDPWTDEALYPVAIASMAKNLFTITEMSEEELREEVEFTLFWALYSYGKYTFRKEVPILDVEEKDLPINLDQKELKIFREALTIVIEHYDSISYGIGKSSLLKMEHFEPFFTRTEKFTMDIPAVWLNT